jgi:hypothetical protein
MWPGRLELLEGAFVPPKELFVSSPENYKLPESDSNKVYKI